MTSSDEAKPRARRRLLWVGVCLLLLFGVYSAGWFYVAGAIRDAVGTTIAGFNARGIEADCANLQVSGYPLRLAVDCDNLAYEDDARNTAASTGSLNATTTIIRPLISDVTLSAPLRTAVPGMAPLWIDWDDLEGRVSLAWPLQRGIALAAEGLSGQTDPSDDSEPVQLFSAAIAEGDLRIKGADITYSGRFNELEIAAEAIDNRVLPPFDGNISATLKNGVALLSGRTDSLRGQSINIGRAELSSGVAQIVLSGPASVDANGMIDADLAIKLGNPRAVAAILAQAIPEQARQIKQGFAALALLGDAPLMPLKIVKGKATLGFIPLGQISPVR